MACRIAWTYTPEVRASTHGVSCGQETMLPSVSGSTRVTILSPA